MSKKKNEIDGKVEAYFAANPKAKNLYTTSDGYLFTNKKFAFNHQISLEDEQAIVLHKNPLYIEVETENEEEETE